MVSSTLECVPAPQRHAPGVALLVVRTAWRTLKMLVTIAVTAIALLLLAPRAVGWEVLTVRSGSMGMAAPTGSVVVLRPLELTGVKAGDIILLPPRDTGHGMPVLHRVVAATMDKGALTVRTKGDANPAPDVEPSVLREATSTPVLVVPLLGYYVVALQTPTGHMALVGLVLVTLMHRVWRTLRPVRRTPARAT